MFTNRHDLNNGYHGHSMSDRAVWAYQDGERPISKWTKSEIISRIREIDAEKAKLFESVSLAVLKDKVLCYSSWHHTGDRFNETKFYSVNEEYIEGVTEEEIKKLSERKAEKKAAPPTKSFAGDITYLEWDGTRNHPRAKEVTLNDVVIEERGCFYYVSDKAGRFLVKKKIDSNGTKVVNYAKVEEDRRRREERERRIKELSSPAALEFFEEIKESREYSGSGHIYPRGRKPSRYEYELGLENYFKVGEKRLREDILSGVLTLEIWDGTEWIEETKKGNETL